jgi:thiamine-monophosphate kinase
VVPSERELIEELLAPLARPDDGSLGLTDDAALVAHRPGHDLVVTQDTLVEGVHFRAADAPGQVAQKSLRVNLSDLAAKGAAARCYFLSLALPERLDRAWIEAFVAGLKRDQEEFAVALFGGDTVRSPGPLMVSITACGDVPEGEMVRRSGAHAGERVYVSGTIGDGTLGLAALDGGVPAVDGLDGPARDELARRYLVPRPRLALAPALCAHASAAMDVSDGLVGDLGLLARASGVSAEIEAAAVPLSAAARRAIAGDGALLARALTGGDDYEILCTVAPQSSAAFEAAAGKAGVAVTAIGTIVEGGAGPVVRDAAGDALVFERGSYAHF